MSSQQQDTTTASVKYNGESKKIGSAKLNSRREKRALLSSAKDGGTQPKKAKKSKAIPPPKSLMVLHKEINEFKCDPHNPKCHHDRGGCFARNFYSESVFLEEKMCKLLSVFREKTRTLEKKDLETFALNNIFKKHCKNIDDVINPSQQEELNLFGQCSNGSSSVFPTDNTINQQCKNSSSCDSSLCPNSYCMPSS